MLSRKVLRMIDASLNRAMEGIRVVEDVVRFYVNDKKAASGLKCLRSDLRKGMMRAGLSATALLAARNTKSDVGVDLHSEGEASRANITQIVTSNFKRVEEALRVLEETAKLKNPGSAKAFKKLRYRAYDLEKQITPKVRKAEILDFDIYVVADPEQSLGRPLEKIVREAVSSGARIVQLRDKKHNPGLAKKIANICRKAGAFFIVNDRPDIAGKVNADGVHLGRDDASVSYARKIIGPDKVIGASASSLRESLDAQKRGADYLGVGPVFSTPVKGGEKPVGLEMMRKIMSRSRIPVVAIGGIDHSNAAKLKRIGVKRIAVIRAVLHKKNVGAAVRRMRKLMSVKP